MSNGGAYYNENSPEKAAWLRELIKRELIAPGEVDERSIEDIIPNELAGFTQCHFFAGIGIWSYALRLAGWSDDRRVWTGSCPCQPFSVAGKSTGFADERHLWPAWFWLIEQHKPGVVFGEQVASKDGYAWLDLVQTDMEGLDYSFGPIVLPAAGFGAPHGRHRIFFVADACDSERGRRAQPERDEQRGLLHTSDRGATRDMAEPASMGLRGRRAGKTLLESGPVERSRRRGITSSAVADPTDVRRAQHEREPGRRKTQGPEHSAERDGVNGSLGNAAERGIRSCNGQSRQGDGQEITAGGSVFSSESGESIVTRLERHNGNGDNWNESGRIGTHESGPATETSSPVNGFWRDAEWLYCKDEKYRAAKPGTFPLAHGAPARVVRLRGYGDGIVSEVAKEFIEAYMSLGPV